MKFKELDPLLHNQLRLAIMSILLNVKEAEFTFIKEKTGATAGNLSVQVSKLKKARYIEVKKSFKNNYPLTTCNITKTGIEAFEGYVNALQGYINKKV
ncbi:winged helix-turn-helix domain-containing protein [Arthrospiribacter ruber]|jgi:DNA-binding transcriptional ArsR family regulator|uniref:Transcriptional regulator n=1 Tax=Arthrospiribacter ruber TaxID=2487934 RepID=A0A951J6C1_9BACT|nr:transcriptional regulator [Arthrospiribacter ruber]MBW3470522.1 transcriptional regulator [Arthrospiribacter ruber]